MYFGVRLVVAGTFAGARGFHGILHGTICDGDLLADAHERHQSHGDETSKNCSLK